MGMVDVGIWSVIDGEFWVYVWGDVKLVFLLYCTLFVFTYIGYGLITDLMIRSRYRLHMCLLLTIGP